MSLYSLVASNPFYLRIRESKADRRASDVFPGDVSGLILDFGCGDLRVGEVISERNPDAKIVGIDRIITQNNSDFVQGDVLKLPFHDNVFDYVFAIGALHHNNDVPSQLNEIYRVTKGGGEFILSEETYVTGLGRIMLSLNDIAHNFWKQKPHFYFTFQTYSEWKSMVESAGFKFKQASKKKAHLGLMTYYVFRFGK